MTPFDEAVLRALAFLLRRYAQTGWVPNGEEMHRTPKAGFDDCECRACELRRDLEKEAET